ncbi:isochorismatase family protein [Sulfitobacter aestuarii]|uniref:Isochorismatase family protein n=1 Tax=Sulfitobacter aestuarii TaxID=2161676 RepID=A0ABW5U786_9RHOB
MIPMKRLKQTFTALATSTALLLQPVAFTTVANAQETSKPLHLEGLSKEPTEAANAALFDPTDAVFLLLDHQTGLFQTVNDIAVDDLRRNTVTLTKVAQQADIPIIYTASEPDGPNGPLMPELEELLEGDEDAQYVARQGEVSSWDNADFVAAVEATGRKTLVIAGVWTSVCVAFPALQAKADGYDVFVIMDASGDVSEMASMAAMQRMAIEGIEPLTTNTILSEAMRTWNRPDAMEWAELFNAVSPGYQAAAESYGRAQEAATKSE